VQDRDYHPLSEGVESLQRDSTGASARSAQDSESERGGFPASPFKKNYPHCILLTRRASCGTLNKVIIPVPAFAGSFKNPPHKGGFLFSTIMKRRRLLSTGAVARIAPSTSGNLPSPPLPLLALLRLVTGKLLGKHPSIFAISLLETPTDLLLPFPRLVRGEVVSEQPGSFSVCLRPSRAQALATPYLGRGLLSRSLSHGSPRGLKCPGEAHTAKESYRAGSMVTLTKLGQKVKFGV